MSMFQLVLLYQFSVLFEIVVVLLLLVCNKLKSGHFKRIFLIIALDVEEKARAKDVPGTSA